MFENQTVELLPARTTMVARGRRGRGSTANVNVQIANVTQVALADRRGLAVNAAEINFGDQSND